MHQLLKISLIIISTLLAHKAYADEEGAYMPFVAVDAGNGALHDPVRKSLDTAKIGYKMLSSPITTDQIKGANILLISGPFRTSMTKPKEGEKNHNLYSQDEILSIKNFVEKGGILIGAGPVWPWVSAGYGNKPPETHPLNQIGKVLDFSVEGACQFQGYERKFHRFVRDLSVKENASFSNIQFKGSHDKYITSNSGYCGAGAKRGNGYIYIFGHQQILIGNPDLVSTVFLELSPQKRLNSDQANTAKVSEVQDNQENHPTTESSPEVAVSNINPIDLLAQEGPNLIAWVSSPLNVKIPEDLRPNILLLRENMLDGQANNEKAKAMNAAGAELCDKLISSIDMKEKQQINAKLKVAQEKSRSLLTNQALEERRNYKMSWPQYEREVRQREVLAENKDDSVEVRTHELEVKWTVTAGDIRKSLDVKYSQFRAAMRNK